VQAVNLAPEPAPPSGSRFDFAAAHAPCWADIEWLAAAAGLPVVVKGVLHPDDAKAARDSGAAGVARMLRLLRDETEIAMALCGCRTPAEVSAGLLRR
jgi:isopentenyl diphosphate isomerase/L-lactate dehydrogenase-like FMN-dependent dehydrogenase